MLDSKHEGIFPGKPSDDNDYIPGTISGHNVMIVGLALKSTGTVSAATLAQSMRSSFPNIEYGLVVGIGAGVPGANLQPDIRLGDIIVGTPGDGNNEPQGVIGYELGKETVDGFVKTSWLYLTHWRLRNAIRRIRGDNEHDGKNTFITHLQKFNATPTGKRFSIPNQESDVLYEAETDNRLATVEITRPPRKISEPVVHYGLIASGDKLIRTAKLRDQLRDRYNIICFEMEAAGVINTLLVAVIRGVCDYADSHKND
jgi:nucleoside phosphorylase